MKVTIGVSNHHVHLTEEDFKILFGSDKESFVEAAKYIYENMKPDIIDINMGCPVPKVAVKAQAGSALLKNPDKLILGVRDFDKSNVPPKSQFGNKITRNIFELFICWFDGFGFYFDRWFKSNYS